MATETKAKKTVSKSMSATKEPKAPKAVKATVAKVAVVDERNGLEKRKVLTGVVVSDKMMKTIIVKVDRPIRHLLYKKYITKSKKFKAHDENNTAKMGDLVSIVESRPLSREKRWALQRVVRKADQTIEANV